MWSSAFVCRAKIVSSVQPSVVPIVASGPVFGAPKLGFDASRRGKPVRRRYLCNELDGDFCHYSMVNKARRRNVQKPPSCNENLEQDYSLHIETNSRSRLPILHMSKSRTIQEFPPETRPS